MQAAADEKRQARSAPPERSQSSDVIDPLLMGRHSKLYQRRKEIESDLRQQFSLPEEAMEVLSQLRSRRSSSYGCPPPVPKPRAGKSKLPPIPKPSEPRPNDASHFAEKDVVPPWWKVEQENLARRDQEREAAVWSRSPEPRLAPHVAEVSSAAQAYVLDQSVHLRPQSWRIGRHTPDQNASDSKNPSDASFSQGHQFEEPWKAKARELQALASAHRLKHEELKRQKAKAEQEIRRDDEKEDFSPTNPASQGQYSQEYLKELREREEQRFQEMKREELRKLQKDREEASKRRQEQEEWEKAMRRQFAEEAERLKAAQKQQQEVEEEQQRQWQQEMERQRAERKARRRREAEREERHRAREAAQAEAQQARAARPEHMPDPPRSFRPEVPGFQFGADHHRSSSQPSFSPSSGSVPPRPAPPGGRQFEASARKRVKSEQAYREPKFSTGELQAAKSAAMRQLLSLKQNPSREARQKGFKELLRVWHPDKNPESCEVATAVFQMIQAERSRILPK